MGNCLAQHHRPELQPAETCQSSSCFIERCCPAGLAAFLVRAVCQRRVDACSYSLHEKCAAKGPPSPATCSELDALLSLVARLLDTQLVIASLFCNEGDNKVLNYVSLQPGRPMLCSMHDCPWSCITQHPRTILCSQVEGKLGWLSPSGPHQYCASPLISCDGQALGALCVIGMPHRLDIGMCRMLTNFAELAARIVGRHFLAEQQLNEAHKQSSEGLCDDEQIAQLIGTRSSGDRGSLLLEYCPRKQLRHAAGMRETCVLLVDTGRPGWPVIWADSTWKLWSGSSAHAVCGQPLAAVVQRSKDTIAPIQWDLKQENASSQARFIMHSIVVQPTAGSSSTNSRVMDLSFRPLALDLLDSHTLPISVPSHVVSTACRAHLQLYAVRVHAAGACDLPVQPLLPTMQVPDDGCSMASQLASSMFVDLSLHQLLGAGAHGQAYLGHWHGAKVVVKVQDYVIHSSRELQQAQLEVALGQLLRHPHLVRTLGHGSAELPMPATTLLNAVSEIGSWRLSVSRSSCYDCSGQLPVEAAPVDLTGRLPAACHLINAASMAVDLAMICSGADDMALPSAEHAEQSTPLSAGYNGLDVVYVARATGSDGGALCTAHATAQSGPIRHADDHNTTAGTAYPLHLRTLAIQEFGDCGTLQNALDQGCFCSKGCWAHLDCVLATLKDIAAGCAHLHQNGVVHADLSSSNVLLFARKPAVVADMEDVALDEGYSRQLSKYTLVSTIDEPALQHVAKVADFGKARLLGPDGSCKADGLATLTCMAPEVIKQRLLSPASDVYSLGVLLWQMLTSQQPWQGFSEHQILNAVVAGEHQLVWPDAGLAPAGVFGAAWYSTVALGRSCIDPEACRRPTMSAIVEQVSVLAAELQGS